MKKKLFAVLLTISLLFGFSYNANAVVSTSNHHDGKKDTLKFGGDGHAGRATTVNFGSVKAYCIDPGSTPIDANVDCPAEVITDEPFASAAKYILSSEKYADNEDVINTALRIVALATNKGAIGYKLDDKDDRNTVCAYVNATYQVTGKIIPGYGSLKSSGNTDCKNYTTTGDPIKLAKEALAAAKSGSNTGGGAGNSSSAPTAVVKVNGDMATITVDNSKGSSDATLTITCNQASGNGCGTHTIAKGAPAQTFTVKSDKNDSKQCGTFTGTLTYKPDSSGGDGGKGCSEVTRYNCSKKAIPTLQDYVGCTVMDGKDLSGNGNGNGSNPGGSNNSGDGKIDLTDPNKGGKTIYLKCEDRAKNCPYTENDVVVKAEGDGICDKDGNTLVSVGEAATFTKDVEDCIIDNKNFLVKSSDNEVCKTYCVEDYSFESDGLMLSSQDKDPVTGMITITAGSYFNFNKEEVKAIEKGTVKCYTKLDLDTFRSKVEDVADQTCGAAKTTVTHSCTCTTDPDTNVKSCTDYVTTTTYKAHYTNNKIEWISNDSLSINTGLSTCDGLTNQTANTASCEANYVGQVNNLIQELKDCAKDAADKVSYSLECNSEVKFDYGFNVDAITLTGEDKEAKDTVTYHANCGGDFEKCATHSASVPEANLDLGIGTSVKYPTLEYVEKVSELETDYSLKGLGICNDYNEGTSNYPVDKENCKAEDGKTWVQGWPISYDTPQGNYKYEISVKDFGHIYDNAKCKTLDHYVKKEISYGCDYQVNGCKECEFSCPPENEHCNVPDCNKDCMYSCVGVGCIYDAGNGLALNYQPISMINVDQSFAYLADRNTNVSAVAAGRNAAPQATKLAATATHRNVNSYNWNTEKGKATLDIIEDNGEEIYSEAPEYKVTLTMAKINEIKKNNAAEKEGFLNKSLKCEITAENKDLEYVTCTSKFLDELRKEGILEGKPEFKSVEEINDYVTGYNVVSSRKSGTGPAWK